jgi:hypothetical protein
MEDGRSGLDLTAAAWSRRDARERRRWRLAAGCPRACVRERENRELTWMALEARQNYCLAYLSQFQFRGIYPLLNKSITILFLWKLKGKISEGLAPLLSAQRGLSHFCGPGAYR